MVVISSGKFATIEQIKTQVVAGIFYTFVLKSSLDEQVEIKLFRSLPSGTTPRKISYEVSYAIPAWSENMYEYPGFGPG